mgnify:FL=1
MCKVGRLIMWRSKSNALWIAACVARYRCAETCDLNPSIFRSRLRMGRVSSQTDCSRQATRPMNPFPTERPKRRNARCKPVGDDAVGFDRIATKQLLQQFRRRSYVATFLNHDVENLTLANNRTLQKHALAGNLADQLVEMPAP